MAVKEKQRSQCPQNLALEVFGDKWTLLIIRDMMLDGKTNFREFLQSKEKIATNVLSSRLRSLEEEGIIKKTPDPSHKQKITYLLTKKGIDLFPILIENARWSLKYKKVDKTDIPLAQELLSGGPGKIKSFMKSLEKIHISK